MAVSALVAVPLAAIVAGLLLTLTLGVTWVSVAEPVTPGRIELSVAEIDARPRASDAVSAAVYVPSP